MLVLSRMPDEKIMILKDGNTIATITICKVYHSGQVKMGFQADPEIKIVREEVLKAEISNKEKRNG